MQYLICITCHSEYSTNGVIYTCSKCDGLLDFVGCLNKYTGKELIEKWERRLSTIGGGRENAFDKSGVWRYRELLPEAHEEDIVTLTEGNTPIWDGRRSASYAGVDKIDFKHLGMNPTGSFKDLGMTTGITQAKRLGATGVACASTGNTSASMAAYAARAGMNAVVFIPAGQIAIGKLAQALDYGAEVKQIDGNFDDAMRLVRKESVDTGLYLLNSVNPFRLEGQKTTAFELMQQRNWIVPDRIVVPGGNLGNSSAITKGFHELFTIGIINKMPKLTIVQAEGAAPLYKTWKEGGGELIRVANPHTLASAIKIGSPVSWQKALNALKLSDGNVEIVSEKEIAEAKAMIGRDGIGCEPASAVTLAGIKKLAASGDIKPNEDIVAILTGNLMKDPDYIVKYHNGSLL